MLRTAKSRENRPHETGGAAGALTTLSRPRLSSSSHGGGPGMTTCALMCAVVMLLVYILDNQTFPDSLAIASSSFANTGRRPRALSAEEIVEKAFNETYASLFACSGSANSCMSDIYHSDEPLQHWWYRTVLRDSLLRENFVFSTHHVLRSGHAPEVEMCSFGKVATTQWRKVFCTLDAKANNCEWKENAHTWVLRGSSVKDGFTIKEKRRFVFVRDPLERFLSAYLDKCSRKPFEGHCEPNRVFGVPSDGATDLLTGVRQSKKELFEAYVDTMPLKWNMHFIPQSLFCGGLYREVDDYDFVGSFGDNFYHDVYDMGQRYGGRMMRVLEDVFNVSSMKDQVNQGTETSATTKVYMYYTPKTVRRVLEYLSIDYVAFNLDIPMWAKQMLEEDTLG